MGSVILTMDTFFNLSSRNDSPASIRRADARHAEVGQLISKYAGLLIYYTRMLHQKCYVLKEHY